MVKSAGEAAAFDFVGFKVAQGFRALRVQIRGIPEGISAAQFGEMSSMLNNGVSRFEGEIAVHGSRVNGTAMATSDLDIAVRVSPEQFDELIRVNFGTPNPGSSAERTMLRAIKTGKFKQEKQKFLN